MDLVDTLVDRMVPVGLSELTRVADHSAFGLARDGRRAFVQSLLASRDGNERRTDVDRALPATVQCSTRASDDAIFRLKLRQLSYKSH